MDKHLGQIAGKLKSHLEQKNIKKYIQISSVAIEQATAEFGQLDSDAYRSIAGRSKINIKNVKDPKPAVFVKEANDIQQICSEEAGRSLSQYRRLVAIRGCANKIQKDRRAQTSTSMSPGPQYGPNLYLNVAQTLM